MLNDLLGADARREIGKWLNDEPNRPIDRQALAELCAGYDMLRTGHQRYETARRMNPRQWADAWKLNTTTGKPFDEIIDDMRPFMVPNVEVQGQFEAALRPAPLERPVGGESQSPQHGEKG